VRTLIALSTLALGLGVPAVYADVYDPPQFPNKPPADEPPQFPRAPAAGWEEVPSGYPPPPSGFKWQKYPSGQWGLVQFGASIPTTPTVPVAVVVQSNPRPFESRPVTDTTPAIAARTAAGASTRLALTTGTGLTRTFAPGAGRVGGTDCAVG
jgi:hypothetical protein